MKTMAFGKIAALVATVLAISGCAITQEVRPVQVMDASEICIVRNEKVRESFLEAYQRALERKGFEVRVIEPGSRDPTCPLTTTYTANWRWDLALYMAYARLRIFRGSEEIGTAEYDSMRGGANMGKFINAESKLNELVDELFTHR
jgi:hypothetical protein